MRLDFTKCHGSGNDFALVDARASSLTDWSGVARALSDRAGPVGSDGLLLLTPGDDRVVDAAVPPLATRRRFTAVAMPNPHLIAFVDAVDDDELSAIGRECEAAPDWLPNRANVSFVELRPAGLFVRTFERGVGL